MREIVFSKSSKNLIRFFCIDGIIVEILGILRFILFSIISFLYSFKIILIDTIVKYPIGQLLYLMGTSCLVYLGLFRYHRLPKIITTILINYILIAHSIRFGVDVLINSIIYAMVSMGL